MQLKIVVPNERERLRDLTAAIDAVLAENRIPANIIADVRLIAEEVVCNAMDHGLSQDEQHEIMVELSGRDGRLHLSFRDDGVPFNPLEAPPPDLDADILDRPIGGLGLHLIRELAEDVRYERIEPYNLLHVVLVSPPLESPA